MHKVTVALDVLAIVVCCVFAGGCSVAAEVNSPWWHARMLKAGHFERDCPQCGDCIHSRGVCGEEAEEFNKLVLATPGLTLEEMAGLIMLRRQDYSLVAFQPLMPHHLRELIRLRACGGVEALLILLESTTPTPFWFTKPKGVAFSAGPSNRFSADTRATVGDLADFGLQRIYEKDVGWILGQGQTERRKAISEWVKLVGASRIHVSSGD